MKTSVNSLLIGIGDLHGHYPALEQLLEALQESHRIFDGRTPDRLRRGVKLVFTGDFIDRGDQALAIIARLQRLSDANPRRVIPLMGNHELMALEAYDEAAGLARRHRGDDLELSLSKYEEGSDHGRNGGTEFLKEFGGGSLGVFDDYVVRMARQGDIGGWMRALRPCQAVQIAGRRILFMHGDLPAELRDKKVLDRYLKWMDQQREVSTLEAGGTRAKWGHSLLEEFFWRRSFSALENADSESIAALCRKVGVDFIVTGHTPHKTITTYGNRIFDIDVGMTPVYGERTPEALVIDENGITGIRTDGKTKTFVRFQSAE